MLRPAGLPAPLAGAIILAVQALVTLPAALLSPIPRPWSATSIRWLLVLSACDAANVLLFFAAMERTTVAVAVLTHYLAPVLVALAAPALGAARVRGAVLAAVAATAGLALVLEPWRSSSATHLAGALLGGASAFAYAGNVLATTILLPRIGAARTIAHHSILSAAVLALVLAGSGELRIEPRSVMLVAAAGAVLGGLAAALFVRGLETVGPTRAALLTYLEPLTAVVVGAWAWGERPGPLALVGAAMVLAAGVGTSLARTQGSGPEGHR